MEMHQMLGWVGFSVFILIMLALDLGVFHHQSHVVTMKEAILWSVGWVVLALIFNIGIYFYDGSDKALKFLTGYLVERALSLDNIFVFLLIFNFFRVPELHQYKVLFWGIVGAIVIRGVFIAMGVTLIEKFHWVVYVLGFFLVVTGIKLAMEKDKKVEPEKNPVLKLFRKFMPVTKDYEGGQFFVRGRNQLSATPLFVTLLAVATTDVVFAVDSIPAILAITTDLFIVVSSNVFAILGLRALYFALAGMMKMFHLLHYGLAAILVFVGIKMILADIYKIPIGIALDIIVAILGTSILLSFWLAPKAKKD